MSAQVTTTSRDVPAPRSRSARFQRTPSASPTLILLVILTCQLMVVLDATIVNVALPDIQSALHFSRANLSWVLNAYTLTFGGLLLLGARAGDILGRRRTFLAGIAIFTLASLVGGFATSGGFLLAARAGPGRRRRTRRAVRTRPAHDACSPRAASGCGPSVSTRPSPSAAAPSAWSPAACSPSGCRGAGCCSSTCPIGLAVLVARPHRAARDPAPRRTLRPRRCTHLDTRHGFAGLRIRAALPRTAGAIRSRSRRFAAGVVLLVAFVFTELHASSPITPLRLLHQPQPQRREHLPRPAGGRHVRHVLLPHPVPAGRARLQPADDRSRLPAADRQRCSRPRS